jgi:hypothetical protein
MKIVICGSMSSSKQMMEAKIFLEENGYEVIVPKNTEKYAYGDLSSESHHESTKHKIENDLIRKYYEIIKKSDAVLIVNCEKSGIRNYVGGNSFLEASFAHVLNRKLYFLNDIPDMVYSDELKALRPIILSGDLSKLIF